MSESWECPTCQTLNAFGDECYSCGAARPGAPAHPPTEASSEPSHAPTAAAAASDAPSVADAMPPDMASWGLTPAAGASSDVDTEPHPCWCNLVKGPHDTRDHPASASIGDPETDEEADARLDRLEAELARLTTDWTMGQVRRSYADNDDGEQDYEDEMQIFEDHHYTKLVERHHHQIDATYTNEAARTGPERWTS